MPSSNELFELDDPDAPEHNNIQPLPEKEPKPRVTPKSVLDAFLAFFAHGILEHLLPFTNTRMKKRNQCRESKKLRTRGRPVGRPRKTDGEVHSWSKPVTMEEFKVWLSLFLAMGVASQKKVRQYWMTPSAHSPLGSAFFKPRMHLSRWFEILRFVFDSNLAAPGALRVDLLSNLGPLTLICRPLWPW